jgi:NAD(P)-dependent dehydrogenase (short-subunit alcohol dehydrogenase family)
VTQTIVITGGSRGIGAATALLAAKRGFAVCVNYVRHSDAAEQVADEIRAAGGTALAVCADVALEADVVRLFETAEQKLGSITALVNNAGVLEKQCRVEDMDAERLNRVFTTNITGSFLCAREAVRRMSTQRGGSGGAIVNVSSGAARRGSPAEYVDYAASKGAVDTLTIGLAKETAVEGIRVNAVRPGFIDTDIHASGGEPGRIARLSPSIPMQRGGQPEEVATAILWLLSSEASYTTAAIIDICGGA